MEPRLAEEDQEAFSRKRGPAEEKDQPGKYLGDAHSTKRECGLQNNKLGRRLACSGVENEAILLQTMSKRIKGRSGKDFAYHVSRLDFFLAGPYQCMYLRSD